MVVSMNDMNMFWNGMKVWLFLCLMGAIWYPTDRNPSGGWITTVLGDTAFYAGRSLRYAYDYTLGIIL
jgi:hypothetical protein